MVKYYRIKEEPYSFFKRAEESRFDGGEAVRSEGFCIMTNGYHYKTSRSEIPRLLISGGPFTTKSYAWTTTLPRSDFYPIILFDDESKAKAFITFLSWKEGHNQFNYKIYNIKETGYIKA